MTETNENIDLHFFQLVFSLQTGAIQQMGKIASPVSGKVERNLPMAKNSIDMITMLETKMAGNLTKEEKEFIGHVLYELRLNYVDEMKKDEKEKTDAKPAQDSEESTTAESEPKPSPGEPDGSIDKPTDSQES